MSIDPIPGLALWPQRRALRLGDCHTEPLATKLWRAASLLMEQRGELVTHAELLDAIYRGEAVDAEAGRLLTQSTIKRLRQKIAEGLGVEVIDTIKSHGYIIY